MSCSCNLMVLFELHFISSSKLHGCLVVRLSFGLVFIHIKYESNRWASCKENAKICGVFASFKFEFD